MDKNLQPLNRDLEGGKMWTSEAYLFDLRSILNEIAISNFWSDTFGHGGPITFDS